MTQPTDGRSADPWRAQMQQAGELAMLEKLGQSDSAQADINKIESASDDKFKSYWRPVLRFGQLATGFDAAALPVLGAVEAIMTDPATPLRTRLAWTEASMFDRQSDMIADAANLLGLTDAQLDALFVAAAQIN